MSELKVKIESALATFWDERVIPQDVTEDSAEELGADLDSLSCVEVLIVIDKIVGFNVHAETAIRKGGYANREQFITDLSSAVLAQAKENAP